MEFVFFFKDDEQDAFTIFTTCDIKSKKLSRILFAFGMGQLGGYVSAFIAAIVDISMGKADTSKWLLPLPIIVPWDITSLSGWFCDWFLQINTGVAYGFCMSSTTAHFVCFCYYIIAACDHLDLVLQSLKVDYAQIQREENTQNHPHMWLMAKKKLNRSIDMHVKIYE